MIVDNNVMIKISNKLDVKTELLIQKMLPIGWKYEQLSYSLHCALLTSTNNKGYVTIDFDGRGYRAGIATSGVTLNKKAYTGLRWKEKLCNDAIEWLNYVLGITKPND